MTVPVERTNAVIYTEEFLLELLDTKKTPRVPKAIRERALMLLRHYPSKCHMDAIAEREDSSDLFGLHTKIFGKDYK